ncbi:MAG: InlB B-repeat-containing protein, partial [Caldilineaceae bacterium]|nr:InlB B-repeat-containing protein [Caldilineaceae bacterium]
AETVRATDSNGAVIAETVTPVLNLLRQGENTLLLKQIGGLYHIHDVGIRIYFDDQHPLLGPNGQPIQAPNGSLTTIWHDGGLVDAAAGGTLTVNDDQLVLSANVTTPARFVEFHGYYRGYDLDNDDSDGDKTALDTEWHNRLRNNWLPGGLEPNSLGGVIDHIGTLATPSPGAYSIYWDIPHLLNQPNVKFKIRIVDDNYVVREAAGGVSAPFTLQRSKEIVAYSKPDWNDFVLHHGGNRPQTVTVSINLPSNLVVGDYNDAYVLGSYWNNPFLAINSNPKFRAFTSNEDNWTLSMRKLASVTQLRAGSNQFTYSYSGSGFGQFIEKPGPLILLKQTTRAPDNSPPQISQRTPGVNAQNVSPTAAIALTVGDPGRGVNLNTLKLFVNGLQVQPQISGSPDAYSLTYTPPTEFLPNTTVTVRVEGCDYANRCISASNGAYSFTVQGSQHTFSAVASGRGAVQVTPQKALYNYGESVALTATPDPGWVFMGWQGAMDGWGDPLRNYRIPLVVNANGFGRVDKPVEAQINFTTLFANLGQNNTFDPATLLVVEVDEGGQIVDSNVPFQFDRAADYNAAAKASGVLVFLMKGNTEAAGKRTYHVYFDIAGRGITAPTFTNLVTRSNVTDQGQASFRFVTSKATYDFHKFGGGFSSVVDNDGNDWVDFRPTPVSGAGFFRGIPNMRPPPDGYFHPGNEIGATSVVNEGPLKHTISTVTTDGKWEVQWEFFPTYARMTVLKRDPSKNYWVLYEGVPGGSLDVNSDTYTLSDGTTATLVNSFGGDLPSPEWIYFSDPPLGRSLFLVHHDDDSIVDSYRLDNSNPANAKMVIFGFGRALSGNTTHLNAVPNVFTIGFMDETAFTPASAVIDAAYRGLLVSVGSVQAQSLGSQAGASSANFTITGNTVLTALFEPPVSYTLSTTVNGDGAVELNPDFPVYAPGDMVTLTAVANPGAIFTGWAGDASGSNPSITVMMDGNKSITANFDYIPYEVATSVVGNGAIVKEPDQPTYRYGDVITVTATSPSNWRFTGWGGDLTGDDNPALLTVDGAKTLTATFVELHTLAVQYSGQGWVNVSPEEAEYLHGVAVTLTATPDDGWAFTGWSGDLAGDANPATLTMDASKSVTANFVPLYPLSITIIGDGGAVERTPDASDYLAGAQVTLTAVANPGWRFTGWSGDAQSNEPSITLTMDSAKAVTATFVEEEYTLTLNTQGEGGITVDPAKPFYRYGDEVILTATPAEGWVFSAWNGDALSGENPYTLLIDGDKTVTAQFLDAAFTLTTATDGSGTIVVTPNLPHYAPGAEVTVEAAPEAGWAFTGWSGDLAGDINPATLIMDGDKSVVAHFTQNPVTLAVQVAGQGNVVVTPQKAVYSLGETVTLLAVPDRGSLFSSWGGDATGSVNPLTLVMDGSKAVTATFTAAQYTVAVDVVGEGAVEVSPA